MWSGTEIGILLRQKQEINKEICQCKNEHEKKQRLRKEEYLKAKEALLVEYRNDNKKLIDHHKQTLDSLISKEVSVSTQLSNYGLFSQRIPQVLLLLSWTYLDWEETPRNCKQVCRSWKDIAENKVLLQYPFAFGSAPQLCKEVKLSKHDGIIACSKDTLVHISEKSGLTLQTDDHVDYFVKWPYTPRCRVVVDQNVVWVLCIQNVNLDLYRHEKVGANTSGEKSSWNHTHRRFCTSEIFECKRRIVNEQCCSMFVSENHIWILYYGKMKSDGYQIVQLCKDSKDFSWKSFRLQAPDSVFDCEWPKLAFAVQAIPPSKLLQKERWLIYIADQTKILHYIISCENNLIDVKKARIIKLNAPSQRQCIYLQFILLENVFILWISYINNSVFIYYSDGKIMCRTKLPNSPSYPQVVHNTGAQQRQLIVYYISSGLYQVRTYALEI